MFHSHTRKYIMKVLEAYCLKCKGARKIINPVEKTLKNGRPATQGICESCEAKVFRIGKVS